MSISLAAAHNTVKSRGYVADKIFRGATRIAAIVVFGSVLGILISLFIGALPAIQKFGLGFLSSSAWNPVTEEFGALVAIFGTLITSAIALVSGKFVGFLK